MRFAKFWKVEIFELSLTERMFYRDAIRTLQAWKPLRQEFAELEMIRRMLEEEIHLPSVNSPEEGLTLRISNSTLRERAE
ncbi:MAG: hypothetical protein M0Z60_12840 [Nitrospiraceae bacterium]|nr:hypothetical protein [Nitrospiraceae bacterium]